jgi:cell wall assembly regulator SMI1
MSVASLLAELKDAYARADLDCGDQLLPPASKTALDELAEGLSLPLPPALLEVYRVHGGQKYVSPGVTGLFGEHRLLTPRQAGEKHRMLRKYWPESMRPFPPGPDEMGWWVPQLIPFANWDRHDLCIDSESGQVWNFAAHWGLTLHRPSVAAVLREVLEAVRAGEEPQLRDNR